MSRDPDEAVAPDVVAAVPLASAHDAGILGLAASVRLHQEGRPDLGDAMESKWQPPSSETSLGGSSRELAGALIARLRVEGAAKLADEIASLIEREGCPASIEERCRRHKGVFAVFGDVVDVEDVKNWVQPAGALRCPLETRLELDGHQDLLEAFDELIHKHWRPYVPPPGPPGPPPPPPKIPEIPPPRPDAAERRARAEQLAAAHDSHTLVAALFARLLDDGEDVVVGLMMLGWTLAVAGPIVNPRDLVNALVLRYRVPSPGWNHEEWPGYEINLELAQEIADLLDKAPIDRDPKEILDVWTREIAGPVIKAGPLAAALVEELRCSRWEEHQRLAGLLLALLHEAQPPILGADGRLPRAAP